MIFKAMRLESIKEVSVKENQGLSSAILQQEFRGRSKRSYVGVTNDIGGKQGNVERVLKGK